MNCWGPPIQFNLRTLEFKRICLFKVYLCIWLACICIWLKTRDMKINPSKSINICDKKRAVEVFCSMIPGSGDSLLQANRDRCLWSKGWPTARGRDRAGYRLTTPACKAAPGLWTFGVWYDVITESPQWHVAKFSRMRVWVFRVVISEIAQVSCFLNTKLCDMRSLVR